MNDQNSDNKQSTGFNWYVAKRLIIAALLIILVVWAFGSAPKSPLQEGDKIRSDAKTDEESPAAASPPANRHLATVQDSVDDKSHGETDAAPPKDTTESAPHAEPPQQHTPDPDPHEASSAQPAHTAAAPADHRDPVPASPTDHAKKDAHDDTTPEETHAPDRHEEAAPTRDAAVKKEQDDHAPVHGAHSEPRHENLPTGVAFVEAAMAPIDHELNKRFWAWRPNDIVNFTDNINNYQLGVLEVTRRTVVLLAERISRTGTTDAFNRHLENAMNWLMVKADRYWFPAPESKYKESLEELAAYKDELLQGRGSFYTRTDNLIPLLSTYEDLLGSCDENLVKQTNEDGSRVSMFQADDYFFYAKGVASAMATLLEAIHHDFHKTLESRHATELLHHALESCRQAAALKPLLITNGDLDGILANHRANMAAPISHARFYIGQLIKTLST